MPLFFIAAGALGAGRGALDGTSRSGPIYILLFSARIRYQDFLAANEIPAPRVQILDGGIRRWIGEYSEDQDLCEGL